MDDLLEALSAPACQQAAPFESTKQCEHCRKEFTKPKWEAYSDWATRRFCSKPCADAGKVLKIDVESLCALYVIEQKSIPDIAAQISLTKSTVRLRLIQAGVTLRTRAHAMELAKPKLGAGMRGKKIVFSQEWKDNIRASKIAHGEKYAAGVSKKKNGYVEFTRGENKGRSEHVVVMERRLGRHLLQDETVHHIDGDKWNNSDDNLALVTRSGHARLHRREEFLAGKQRKRLKNGRLC
jgi:hypothetical protein